MHMSTRKGALISHLRSAPTRGRQRNSQAAVSRTIVSRIVDCDRGLLLRPRSNVSIPVGAPTVHVTSREVYACSWLVSGRVDTSVGASEGSGSRGGGEAPRT